MTPAGTRVTWFVLGVCVGVIIAVVGMAGIAEAASRTAPDTVPAQSGAPRSPGPSLDHGHALAGTGGVPQPSRLAVPEGAVGPKTPTSGIAGPLISGTASHMGDSPAAGPGYLALPIGRGHVVRLCGAMGCLTVTSNDAGPALFMQRRGRVADLSVELFEMLTGLDRSRGLAPVSWRELP